MLVKKMGLQLLFIAFFLSGGLDFGRAEIGNDSKDVGRIDCKCQGSSFNKTFNSEIAEELYKELLLSYKFGSSDIQHKPEFKKFKMCENCELVISACYKEDPSSSSCTKRTAHFAIEKWRRDLNGTDNTLPIITRLHMEKFVTNVQTQQEGFDRDRRNVRRYDVCMVPSNLRTASLYCHVLPGHKVVKCTQKCLWGYTLEEGITRNYECLTAEDKWKPIGFQECTRFVLCQLMLVKGGYANCTTRTETAGPECLVSCLGYEDVDGVPEQRYKCSIDGIWSPEMPFCAEVNGGVKLAKVPAIMFHKDLPHEN